MPSTAASGTAPPQEEAYERLKRIPYFDMTGMDDEPEKLKVHMRPHMRSALPPQCYSRRPRDASSLPRLYLACLRTAPYPCVQLWIDRLVEEPNMLEALEMEAFAAPDPSHPRFK